MTREQFNKSSRIISDTLMFERSLRDISHIRNKVLEDIERNAERQFVPFYEDVLHISINDITVSVPIETIIPILDGLEVDINAKIVKLGSDFESV